MFSHYRFITYGVSTLLLTLLLLSPGYAQTRKDSHLQKADAYFTAGKYAEAIIELKNALQNDPKDATLHYKLGLAYLTQGKQQDLPQARDAFEKSVRIDSTLTDAQLKLGELYILSGQFNKAQERAEEVLKIAAANVEAHVLLGHAYARRREVAKALEALHKARQLDPARVPTYLHLAMLQYANKDPGAAEKTYKEALTIDPKSVPAHVALGSFYASQKQRAPAEELFRKAIALESDNASLYLQLASFYAAQQQWPEAETAVQQAIRVDAQSLPACLARGDLYAQTQRLDEAAAAYKQCVTLKADAVAPKEKLAELALRQQNFVEAARQAEELIKHRDRESKIVGRYVKGRIALARGQTAEAIITLQGVLKDAPWLAPAHYYLGLAHIKDKKPQLAKTALTKAVEIAPNFAEAHLALAGLALQLSSFDQAIESAQHLLRLQPDNGKAAMILGQAYVGQGDTAQAVAAFKVATEKAPQDASGYFHLGLAYRQQQQNQAARQAFEKALALDPNMRQARAQLTALSVATGEGAQAEADLKQALAQQPQDVTLISNSPRCTQCKISPKTLRRCIRKP